jgi:hypothetical protein
MNFKTRKRTNRSLAVQLCILLVVSTGTCATTNAEYARLPEALLKATEAFKSAPPTNRYAQGERLWRELPKCPLTFQRDTGLGVIRGYDYSKPSYVLSSKDLVGLLGDPLLITTNINSRVYKYLISGKRPEQGWSLCIEIHLRNDYVVL